MPRYSPEQLPHYFAALRADDTARSGISQSTLDRRRAGKFPPMMAWLLERPHLLWALYLDSCDRTQTAPEVDAEHERRPAA